MESKTFTIKLMSIVTATATAFAVTASLPLTPTASAADIQKASTLPTSLQNGDFESPDIESILSNVNWSYVYENLGTYNEYTVSNDINYKNWYGKLLYPEIITYSDGNAWFVTSKTIFDNISDNQFYWETTDYNQRVELGLGTQGMSLYFPDESNGASSGTQFAELVPEKKSSLYQSISTQPGKVLSWSVDHRARKDDTDIMAVFIGPKQEYLQKTSDDSNDIFMEMAELLENQYNSMNIGSQIGPIKLYSKKITNNDHNISKDSVSTTKSTIHTEEWQCWIVKSDAQKWYTYSGTYTVPDGQDESTLAFTAMTSHSTNTEEGNCLDNIRLGELFPLTLTAMPGGTGSMEPNDKGSAAVNVDGDTNDNNTKSQLYEKDEHVTITAKPKDGYIFTGAIVNGETISTNEFINDNSTYTYEITMNQTNTVVLTFAQKGYITYDANGGTLNIGGTPGETYQHEFIAIGDTLNSVPAPEYTGKQFLGWRLFATNNSGDQEEVVNYFIPANHSVVYTAPNNQAKITISCAEHESITLSASEEDAVLLLAVYQQNLSVVPMTRYIGDTSYNMSDDTGGTVTVRNNSTTATDDSSCTITAGNNYTITVNPKDGFKLDRLYYYDVNGRTIPLEVNNNSYTATFTSNRDIDVYAEFGEIPLNAYYSFVPEDQSTIINTSFVKDPSDQELGGYSDKYGGDVYGNTISTGFFTTRQFSTTSKPSGIWTILIPENNTYFKIPNGTSESNIGTLVLDENNILEDSSEVKYNSGTIYGVKDTSGDNNLKIQVYVESDTTISGEGKVQFGLIIDNLYAPNATAGFKETEQKPANVIELNESNSIYTNNGKYQHNEDTLNNTPSQTIE